MTDWKAETTAWVDDGLIAEEQKGPLLERLEALPAARPALPMGPLITVLVAPASFLLIGSAVALLAALVDPPRAVYDLLVGGSGAAFLLLGGALRFVPSVRPLARGFLAASIPMTTFAALRIADENASWLFVAAIAPAAIGWVLGWLENSRAVAASGALMTLIATCAVLLELELGHGSLVVTLLCVLTLAVTTAAAYALPDRATVLHVGDPALILLGAITLVANEAFTRPWLKAIGVQDAWATEKGLLLLAFGTLMLGLGLAGRSGFTLVPAVVCIASSTVWIAFTFGSFIGGAIALALVSGGLFFGAVMLWLLPTLRERAATKR